MTTSANLAVHLKHRGQAITGVEGWRVAVVETESVGWLEGRLPAGLQPTGAGIYDGAPSLLWGDFNSRMLRLVFLGGHAVASMKYKDAVVVSMGDLNLAMDLQEIIDMVRWAMEGR